jgi:hypothetical protein
MRAIFAKGWVDLSTANWRIGISGYQEEGR